MKTLQTPSKRNRRRADLGAVLLVVLIVMVALLGLGMTGLFLTSSSIQMNTNINLRNQALVVAEAGLERARAILNDNIATPPLPTLLAGTNPGAGDEVPASTSACDGVAARGAILVDRLSTGCTSGPAFCNLKDVDYPSSVNRSTDMPAASGAVVRQTMGKYTVYIRQDQADCRMGNFVCDNATVSAGGVAQPQCTAPAGAPDPNGAIVVRSEGVASDGRTRVVLEVTMTPDLGAVIVPPMPLSTLCSAGANGCDDNSSVQSGIVVNSQAPQTPPLNGGSGAGGAPSSGGVTSAGGSGSGGAGGASTTPLGGIASGGAVTTGGASSSGGSGTGGAPSTGGSTGCVPSACPSLATMGIYGRDPRNPSPKFAKWLADHSSTCLAQDLDVANHLITDAMLMPYKVIIVMDVGHDVGDYTTLALYPFGTAGFWPAWLVFSNPSPPVHQFTSQEAQAVYRWVQNGGGLLITNGYDDSLFTKPNFNALAEPLGLVYYSPDCGLNTATCSRSPAYQDAYGPFYDTAFASHPVTVGMTNLFVSGYWPLSGYPATSGFPTAFSSNYKVLTNLAYKNANNVMLNLTEMVAGTIGAGRVVAMGDEWISYDSSLADPTRGPTAQAFWNNALNWLGNCH